jgi:hypothetical protein
VNFKELPRIRDRANPLRIKKAGLERIKKNQIKSF